VALIRLFCGCLAFLCAGSLPAEGARKFDLRAAFAKPPRIYSTAPLWVWNDLLTEEQIRQTLRDLAGQQVKQVFVHPRPGLMTPYLSEQWFGLWKAALREAERLDMNIWIYDENSYPSGFAGGLVPELMPESRGRGVVFNWVEKPPPPAEGWIGTYLFSGEDYQDVSAKVRNGERLPRGRYLVASVRRAARSPWFGGRTYVDLLHPGVTDKFLEVTLGAYRLILGDQFGKRVPGSFTDEPNIRPAGGLPWTRDLPSVFKKRWGYDLLGSLPSLVRPVGDWKRIRHNYFQVLLELFIERWARPYYRYCEKNGLLFTGHYWEHEWPNCAGVPDNMAMSAWQQLPGIDCLMNRYGEDVHAQFGNVRAVRELASVANQLGRERTLCETYGAGGWDLRFEDMKRIGDWLYALGVNFLDQHLSYITIRGARKRDHPQSFSYHEPWWEAYHTLALYFARLSVVLSQGREVRRIIVLEPTTTAWMYQGDSGVLNRLGNDFQKLLLALEAAQVQYDIGCEYIMAEYGSAGGGKLKIGKAAYDTVILPRYFENINSSTLRILEVFLNSGGTVLSEGDPPARLDGCVSDKPGALARHRNWHTVSRENLLKQAVSIQKKTGFWIERDPKRKGLLFHMQRQVGEDSFVFLVNTSLGGHAAGLVHARGVRSAEEWDPLTGAVRPYPLVLDGESAKITFDLPEAGSLLLLLKSDGRPAQHEKSERAGVQLSAAPVVERVDPNVLVLDYVDVSVGGERKERVYFFEAARTVFRKHGFQGNPWERAVQFKDEILKRKFPPESGFEASYRFVIEGPVPGDLCFVLERPDLYSVTCNGKPVKPQQGRWWLDRSFGVIPIAAAAKEGENVVLIRARPFTVFHELEPAYVLGSFSLRPADSGFVITVEKKLSLGPWRRQGLPLYGHRVRYTETLQLPAFKKCFVKLGRWYGSVAKVTVNGRLAGYVGLAPWKLDVTRYAKPGLNRVAVTVFGTLKNTLGPHHGNPPLGSAWPGMFTKAPKVGPPPGANYHTVDYGLFEPFVLEVYK